MNRSLFVLIFFFTMGLSAFAKADCEDLNQNIFSRISFVKTEVDCQFLSDVMTPLMEVHDFFKRKTNLTLFIRERGINASFDNGKVIWLPKNLYAYNEDSLAMSASRNDLSPILLHEIGHSFLNDRLRPELHAEFGDLFQQLDTVSENTLKNTLSGKPSMSSRRFGDHLSQTPDFRRYLKHVVGYAELYADAVSVIYFNDPDVMYGSLRFATHTAYERQFIQVRSFSQQHEVPTEESLITVHTEFAPVRSYIGRELHSVSKPQDRILLLQNLEDVITDQIKAELALPQLPSLAERNENLIQRLKAKQIKGF